MKVLVNGVPTDAISVHDRGFLYGQTVFETIAFSNGKAHLVDLHLNRLAKGCLVLGIEYPAQLKAEIDEYCHAISQTKKHVLRVTLSMGVGGRGYLNPIKPETTRVLSLHDYPAHPKSFWQQGIVCGVAALRLSHQPAFAGLKHGNRLEQTIARSQWPSGENGDDWHEALMLNQNDHVIEATQSNVFILNDDVLSTPNLNQSGVAGVMRETILSVAESLGVKAKLVSLSLTDIEHADAVFLSNSVIGCWPVKRLNDTHYSDFRFAHKLMNLLIKNESVPSY